jgi:hypothetical protein
MMMDDAADIAAVLRGTALEGRPVGEGLGGTFLIAGIGPDDLLDAWRAARAVTPVTGRWPVMTLPDDLDYEPEPVELEELDLAARTVDPWSVFQPWTDDEPVSRSWIQDYVTSFLGADVVQRASGELDAPATRAALDRWTYDTLLSDPALAARGHERVGGLVGTQNWHRWPEAQLVFLPTASQWLTPGWFDYYGATCEDERRALCAALWQWERRWGAELVASWGTMLQLVVGRQPAAGEQAWELAGQLKAVGGSLQFEQWMLALAVSRSDAWFLHDRP